MIAFLKRWLCRIRFYHRGAGDYCDDCGEMMPIWGG